jgi:DNA-binding LacI/PurR family transcriptional regulator
MVKRFSKRSISPSRRACQVEKQVFLAELKYPRRVRRRNAPTAGESRIHPTADARSPRPKIGDVALAAGVSLGTVSAVLNGKGRVSEATRERVRSAIRDLKYRPDLYASNLARRQTRLLGVIVSDLQNPFFAETAQAVQDEASRHGFQISLMTTNFSREQQRTVVQQLLGARIAGIAVLTSEHDEASRQFVLSSGIPAVMLDVGKPTETCSVLRVDARGGMRAAVEHLIRLGHRRILYVRNSQQTGGPVLRSHQLRDHGFAAAVRSSAADGLQTHTVDVHGSGAEAGEQAIDQVFGAFSFTAVVATTDTVALGVYRALQARGLHIPNDVSVVGFDNAFFSRFLNPPLTTVDVSRRELSRMVVSSLLDGRSSTLMRLKTNLLLRESTAAPCRADPNARRRIRVAHTEGE